tara:strand:- start:747 stop:1454 length:708 start_codon:yes stop_codon:yes gene_type:complete
MTTNLLQINNLYFKYKSDSDYYFKCDDFNVEKNNQIFIEGPSGCGKTTFLNLITGLLLPISGNINILNQDLSNLNKANADRFRADHFGIIFQQFNLISYLSVIENIILPCSFSSRRKKKAIQSSGSLIQEAQRLCAELEMDIDLISKPVNQLSIGQQQRVAIARAFIGQPEIIIADEPTSALDNHRKDQFMSLLLEECDKYNTTLFFVSHDYSLQTNFQTVFELTQDGLVYKEIQ